MKKIIGGKLYDTETAKSIKSSSFSYPGQFDYYEETLYRKRTGEYFLAGHGGARSRYARLVETGNWAGGEGITPLSYAEAMEWGEKAMSPEEYLEEFGPVSEDEIAHLHISLPADVADRIRKAAASAGVSVSEYIANKF